VQCPLRSSSRITPFVRVALHAPDFLPAPAPSHLLSLHTVSQHVYTILPRGSCSNNVNALHSCVCVYGDKCHRTHVLAKPVFESSNSMEKSPLALLCTCMHFTLHCLVYGSAGNCTSAVITAVILSGTRMSRYACDNICLRQGIPCRKQIFRFHKAIRLEILPAAMGH